MSTQTSHSAAWNTQDFFGEGYERPRLSLVNNELWLFHKDSAKRIQLRNRDGIVRIGCTDADMDALVELAKWTNQAVSPVKGK